MPLVWRCHQTQAFSVLCTETALMAHLGLGAALLGAHQLPVHPWQPPPSPPHCFPDPRPLSPGLQAWQGPPRAVPPSSASLASSSGSSSSPLVTEPPSSSPSVLPHVSACIHLGPQLFSGNYCVPGSVSEQEMGEGLVPPPRQELGSAQNDSVESQVCQAGCLEEVSHSIAQGGVLLGARQEGISSREVGRSVWMEEPLRGPWRGVRPPPGQGYQVS